MSFANFKPFRKVKASKTFEYDKTCQELTPTTTLSLSLTTTPIPTYHPLSNLLHQH